MNKIIFLLVFTAIFQTAAFAQTVKIHALPAGIGDWNSENSDKILNNPIVKTRLKNLLGKTNYASFMESFETLNPIKKTGNILFSSGCLIHACGHLESAVAIDLINNTIHAAVFNDEKKTKYFNEKGSRTPKSIAEWAARLNSVKKIKAL